MLVGLLLLAAAFTALESQKADVNATQPDGMTALHWAVRQNDLQTAQSLIRAGAKPNVATRYGVTPLYFAAEKSILDSIVEQTLGLQKGRMSNGNQHDHDPLPIVLIGNASGQSQGNRHIVTPPHTPMANLLLSMLDIGSKPPIPQIALINLRSWRNWRPSL